MVEQIDHIIYIVREAHTFDSYFGKLAGVAGVTLPLAPLRPQAVKVSHHAWLDRDKTARYQQHAATDLLDYVAYATQFTLCDHYFSEVGGPSLPNQFMLFSAQTPTLRAVTKGVYNIPSLPQALTHAGISWRNYGGRVPFHIADIRQLPYHAPAEQFAVDATAGALPAVTWLFAPPEYSESPPANILYGQAWTVAQINAIVDGGLWPQCAIILLWDSWGGWGDHVLPPLVETWHTGTPYRYGSRVGCIVISPFARPHFINHTLLSHTSLIKLCTTRFHLPALTERDRAAAAMLDCFDFEQAPLPPPNPLPGLVLTP